MPIAMQVTHGKKAEKPREWKTNTFHLDVDDVINPPDYNALANDTCDIWVTSPIIVGSDFVRVRAYELNDAKPRAPKADVQKDKTVGGPQQAPQVAIVLSYYAERNLPRQRGRMYLGPVFQAGERPSQTMLDYCIAHADKLAALGGANVQWVVYSPTNTLQQGSHQWKSVTHAWVDDSWDIIRSRRHPATRRVLKATGS